MIVLLAIFLSGVMIVPLLLSWLQRGPVTTPWFITLASLGLALTLLLKRNVIPPKTWHGVVAHAFLIVILLFLILWTAFLWQRHSPKEASPQKTRYVKILTIWGLIAASLMSMEILFRTVPVYNTLALNPGVKFFWPDWLYYPLNNFGYREPPFDTNKTDDTYRIILVGDSFVEGAGLTRSQTLGFRLEQYLNQPSNATGPKTRHQVYSLGRCGANTQQEVEDILKISPLLKPDMIILGYVLNDPEVSPPDLHLTKPPPWMTKIHRLFITDVQSYGIQSYGYYWFFTYFNWFRTQFHSLEEILLALHSKEYAGWKIAVDSLNTLGTFVKQNGVDGLGIIYPYIMGENYSPALRAVHKQVSLAMEASGLEVVDLLPVSEQKSPDLRKLKFSPRDPHPSAAANLLWGEYLAEVIRSRPSYINWQKEINH